MIIGCPKEIKIQEGRVGLTPAGADALVKAGHIVYMEHNAGVASGFMDEEYVAVASSGSSRTSRWSAILSGFCRHKTY